MDAENVRLLLDEKRLKVNKLIYSFKRRLSWARIKRGIEGDLAEEKPSSCFTSCEPTVFQGWLLEAA